MFFDLQIDYSFEGKEDCLEQELYSCVLHYSSLSITYVSNLDKDQPTKFTS